jgi:predicted DNA-binding transcriptional regulator AlpA
MTERVLIDEKELARITGIKHSTWAKWRANDEGPPYFKLGRLCRYRLSAVEDWIAAREQVPHD